MKKILVLSVSAGQGHVRAADALVASAARWFPETEVRHIDMMTLVPTLFRKTYKDAYVQLVGRSPALWGYLYAKSDRSEAEGRISRLRRSWESYCSKPLRGVLNDFKPDHVISTHFMPAQVLRRWRDKGSIDVPLWVVVTDFEAHAFWLTPGLDGYFTACEENAFRMARRGLHGERIIVSGIPVMPEFGDPIPRQEGAARFGLDPGRTTFLLMGGGEGVGALKEVAEELTALPHDFQLAALAGKNRKLLEDLELLAVSRPGRLFPLGYTTEMPWLTAAADLVISKPGGLTTVECLARGRAMIALSPIPGQEEANAAYLMENGAALKANDLSGLIFKVRRLLEAPEMLAGLSERARALGRPEAGREILQTILS